MKKINFSFVNKIKFFSLTFFMLSCWYSYSKLPPMWHTLITEIQKQSLVSGEWIYTPIIIYLLASTTLSTFFDIFYKEEFGDCIVFISFLLGLISEIILSTITGIIIFLNSKFGGHQNLLIFKIIIIIIILSQLVILLLTLYKMLENVYETITENIKNRKKLKSK